MTLIVPKRKKITVPMSQSDCEEIMNGSTFDWTFDDVDVHIKLESNCDQCGEDDDDLVDGLCVNCRE